MNDILEHLDDMMAVVGECYILLKLGGQLKIRITYWNHKNAYSDPTHKHFITEGTFKFFKIGRAHV